MKTTWKEALRADLLPRHPKDARTDEEKREEHVARWYFTPASKGRASASLPGPTPPREEYDIAAHANRSLQISGESSGPIRNNGLPRPTTWSNPQSGTAASFDTRPSNTGNTLLNQQWRNGHQRVQSFPTTPSYSIGERSGRSGPPPVGPRPNLYSQEVQYRYHAVDDLSPRRRRPDGTGGFVDPRNTPLTGPSSFHPSQKTITHQHNLQERAPRQHTISTPPRPDFLATPPPVLGPRAHSDPQRTAAPSPSSSRHAHTHQTPETGRPGQCQGITGAGRRCTRTVKTSKTPPTSGTPSKQPEHSRPAGRRLNSDTMRQLDRRLSMARGGRTAGNRKPVRSRTAHRVIEIDSDSDDDDVDFEDARGRLVPKVSSSSDDFEELPVYCFQHIKQTMDQGGTFIGPKFVDFKVWIKDYLPQETQLQLRHEISKGGAIDDVEGYIYVHEFPMGDYASERKTTLIKLGRSIRPVERLSQWKSQCKSRQPIVRDIFPLHPLHPLNPAATATSLIAYSNSPAHQHGRLQFATSGGKNHRKWERLCLIELAGRSALQAYDRNEEEAARQACVDCGKIHVEMFLMNVGSYETEVRDMVLHWQKFVETIL